MERLGQKAREVYKESVPVCGALHRSGGLKLLSGESGRVLRVGVFCGVVMVAGAGLGRGTWVVEAQKNQDPMQQVNQDPMTPSTTKPGGMPSDEIDTMDARTHERMNTERLKALNDSRHKRLEDDASKLLALSTELKSDVEKANKDELSLDVMRKAAEIEKLAHDVQSRMKN